MVVLGVCCLLVLVAAIGALRNSAGEEDTSEQRPIVVRPLRSALSPEEMRQHIRDAESYVPPMPEATVRDAIESHQARIDADPESPDAPGLWVAKGNLYRIKLGDPAQAAYCYEQVLRRYPDYPGRHHIYPELAMCYEMAGDRENLTRIYMDMLNEFPEESEWHLFARIQLGLEHWEEGEGRHPRLFPDTDDEIEEDATGEDNTADAVAGVESAGESGNAPEEE